MPESATQPRHGLRDPETINRESSRWIRAERPRLEQIRNNLNDRIAEAEREGWLGDVEQLSVSLDAAEDKITQIEAQQRRKESPVFLGIPAFDQMAGRTS
ncbi:hypothetical protein OG762_50475 (plasmid) [Streptomyces sp. NBC_01136]|uniref:hypothetical protein n=1 Tax=Streptomyces sp. NBC_01136 TaxID=2903754 RepID=UPI002F90E614|nr:hypothetical protein OG762_50475 [Streptomyces sp. NBC_01136]